MRRRWIFFAPLAILGLLAFVAVGGIVVQVLWNWLLPALFGWPPVTFWQAVGLLALCRILFGGFGSRAGRHAGFRRRGWDRCVSMSPEERERFRQGMRTRWDAAPSAAPNKEV